MHFSLFPMKPCANYNIQKNYKIIITWKLDCSILPSEVDLKILHILYIHMQLGQTSLMYTMYKYSLMYTSLMYTSLMYTSLMYNSLMYNSLMYTTTSLMYTMYNSLMYTSLMYTMYINLKLQLTVHTCTIC